MQLYNHQQNALEQSKGQTHVAYYHDMGLGKTFTGAEKMNQLCAYRNLLICQKSKISDWIEHFEKYYFPKLEAYDLTKKKEFKMFVDSDAISPVGIINYELAWRRPELLQLHDFTLMLDESSLIQNRKAKQTKFILKLQPANVILLSGTPTAGKYENLWTQLHLLGWEISESAYNAQFVNWKTQKIGWMNPKIIRIVDKVKPYKNVERLKEKMREHGAQFLKTEECFELPEQTFIEVNVSKHTKYDKFMKDSLVVLESASDETEIDYAESDFYGTAYKYKDVELVGDTTLTKRLYARQLCGMYSKEKLQAFKELLESTNDRLIVFYNFNDEFEQLARVCETLNKPTSVINGSRKDLDVYENKPDSVTLVQYQAGAMGLNLQKANKVIYFSLPERSELFEQSKKRIHRIGQEQPCFYYVMMCGGTIEKDIFETLKQRKDYTDELFRKSSEHN